MSANTTRCFSASIRSSSSRTDTGTLAARISLNRLSSMAAPSLIHWCRSDAPFALGARARELEPGKAESDEEAEFTIVNEHSESDSNAAWPTRSSPMVND
ncbi:hypothetical protein D9M70_649070 [compost metagenome]